MNDQEKPTTESAPLPFDDEDAALTDDGRAGLLRASTERINDLEAEKADLRTMVERLENELADAKRHVATLVLEHTESKQLAELRLAELHELRRQVSALKERETMARAPRGKARDKQ